MKYDFDNPPETLIVLGKRFQKTAYNDASRTYEFEFPRGMIATLVWLRSTLSTTGPHWRATVTLRGGYKEYTRKGLQPTATLVSAFAALRCVYAEHIRETRREIRELERNLKDAIQDEERVRKLVDPRVPKRPAPPPKTATAEKQKGTKC